MKWVFILLLGIILSISCHKETGEPNLRKKITSSQIDTTILIVDILQLSLGSLDKQEGITIVKEPNHAKLFEVTGNDQGKQDLVYVPQDNYLGVDSVLIITKQTNLGEDPFIKLDSSLFVIRVLKNDFHRKLIGKWYLWTMCGGFMGTCDTIGGDGIKVEFGYNMDYIETFKDSIVKKRDYYLIDSLGYQYACINEVSSINIKYKRSFRYYGNSLHEYFSYMSYTYLPFKDNK